MSKIRSWILATRKKHPQFWAALKTAVAAFAAIMFPVMFNYMAEITKWANNTRPDFPDPDGLTKTFVLASLAALAGLLNYLWNRIAGNGIKYTVEEE